MRMIDKVDLFIKREADYTINNERIIENFINMMTDSESKEELEAIKNSFKEYKINIRRLNEEIDNTPELDKKFPIIDEREEYQIEIMKEYSIIEENEDKKQI